MSLRYIIITSSVWALYPWLSDSAIAFYLLLLRDKYMQICFSPKKTSKGHLTPGSMPRPNTMKVSNINLATPFHLPSINDQEWQNSPICKASRPAIAPPQPVLGNCGIIIVPKSRPPSPHICKVHLKWLRSNSSSCLNKKLCASTPQSESW